MAMPNWISVDSNRGGAGSLPVNVTATGNASTSARSGTLTVETASGLTKTISLFQNRASIDIVVGGVGGYLAKLTV